MDANKLLLLLLYCVIFGSVGCENSKHMHAFMMYV